MKENEQHWQEVATRLSQMTDKWGRKIEPGILETVIAFHVLDIPISYSSEGYLHPATAPWIIFHSVGAEEIEAQAQELSEKLRQAKIKGADSEETYRASGELFRLAEDAQLIVLRTPNRVMNLLKLFYHERHVPYDCQLTLQGSSFGLNRLESRGAFFLDSATPEVQAQKLRNYRQEMQDVAAFIKERYFDEDEVINNGYDG